MRRLILMAVVTIAVAGCGGTWQSGGAAGHRANASAIPESAAPSTRPTAIGLPFWLDDLQMVSAQDGWALVWKANPAGSGSPALELARTGDGARDWQRVTLPVRGSLTPGQVVLDAVSAQLARLAVGIGSSDSLSSGSTMVYSTTDGGQEWSAGTALSGSQPAELAFTGSDGWLLENLGEAMQREASTLWRTVNGGATWTLAARTPPLGQPPSAGTDLPSTCDKTGLAFASAQVGWITSFCNTLPGAVLVTRDGGAHWATQPVPVAASACQSGCNVYAPQFAGQTTFLPIDAYPSAGYLLVSDDSGASWTELRLPAGAGPYPHVTFFGAAAGIATSAGPQGVIGPDFYLTADGGRTWTAVQQGRTFGSGTSFDFVTPGLGFAWTSEGRQLAQTSDSGRTWTVVTPHLT